MSDKNTSTLQSYVDAATGMMQKTVGTVIGNKSDETAGDAKQQKAQAEYDASHAAAKLPGFTASASGVTKDDPDRATGAWNQTEGSVKEAVGGLVGSESLKQQGRKQNLEGQQQEAAGQAKDWAGGVSDRVTGALGGAAAGVVGDRDAQKGFQEQHDKGKTAQRGAEFDIQKQADAKTQV